MLFESFLEEARSLHKSGAQYSRIMPALKKALSLKPDDQRVWDLKLKVESRFNRYSQIQKDLQEMKKWEVQAEKVDLQETEPPIQATQHQDFIYALQEFESQLRSTGWSQAISQGYFNLFNQLILSSNFEDVQSLREDQPKLDLATKLLAMGLQHPHAGIRAWSAYYFLYFSCYLSDFQKSAIQNYLELAKSLSDALPLKTLILKRIEFEKSLKSEGLREPSFVVHVGMPRAASTWLQSQVFAFLPGIQNLGDFYIDLLNLEGRSTGIHRIPTASAFAMNENEPNNWSDSEYYRLLETRLKSGSRQLLSHEGLFRNLEYFLPSIQQVAANKALKLKFILVTRRQDALLRSIYIRRLSSGRCKGQSLQSSLADTEESFNFDQICLKSYDYLSIYQKLSNLVPKEHIKLICFEDLTSGEESMHDMTKFMGVDLPEDFVSSLVNSKPFNETPQDFKEIVQALNPEFDQDLVRLADYYRKSNKELASLANTRLEIHDYF